MVGLGVLRIEDEIIVQCVEWLFIGVVIGCGFGFMVWLVGDECGMYVEDGIGFQISVFVVEDMGDQCFIFFGLDVEMQVCWLLGMMVQCFQYFVDWFVMWDWI